MEGALCPSQRLCDASVSSSACILVRFVFWQCHKLCSLELCVVIHTVAHFLRLTMKMVKWTSGQRVLRKGCITGWFRGRQCVVTPTSWEYCSRLRQWSLRTELSLLLHTSQMKLPILFSGPDSSPKLTHLKGGSLLLSNTFPWAHMSWPQMASDQFGHFLYSAPCDQHTDRTARDISSNRPHLCMACMQCGQIVITKCNIYHCQWGYYFSLPVWLSVVGITEKVVNEFFQKFLEGLHSAM